MTNEPLKLIREIEKELQTVHERITNLNNDVSNLQDEAKRLELTIKDLSGNVITREKFAPYEKLLGVVGVAIVLAIVAAFMASILK
jgi:predicted  nucleic acid-binding Zn-ribbon protein